MSYFTGSIFTGERFWRGFNCVAYSSVMILLKLGWIVGALLTVISGVNSKISIFYQNFEFVILSRAVIVEKIITLNILNNTQTISKKYG